jgi:DNA-binding NtrC family response regulator
MEPQKQVLIASSNLEMHKRLTLIFSPWHLDLLSCCSLKAAQEILARQPVFLAFCEDRLPDGSYHELLAASKHTTPISRLVVVFKAPNNYEMRATAAVERGAFATIGPFSDDIEVESVLIRAIRDDGWSPYGRSIDSLLRPGRQTNGCLEVTLKLTSEI